MRGTLTEQQTPCQGTDQSRGIYVGSGESVGELFSRPRKRPACAGLFLERTKPYQASSSKHSARMARPLSNCASGMVIGIRKRMTL